MISRRVVIAFLGLLALGGCATPHQNATVYACGPSDHDAHRIIFHPNGRFVVNLTFVKEDGGKENAGIYGGYYTEAVNTYDLKFDNLSRDKIEILFKGTIGGFVKNTDIYRIGKKYRMVMVSGVPNYSGKLVVNGCRMDRLP